MLVEAYKLIMQVDPAILFDVLGIFNDTAIGVCEGQQIDMNFETIENVDEGQYMNMIRLKTAVLLGAALKIGSLVGGASAKDANLLYDYGVHLGIAFQLHDDILDVYGDPEKFGKQIGGDIISNKKTFMVIKAKELAYGETKTELEKWLKINDNPSEKVAVITKIYSQLGVKKLAEQEMAAHAEYAIKSLALVSVKESKKEILGSFADSLLVREH